MCNNCSFVCLEWSESWSMSEVDVFNVVFKLARCVRVEFISSCISDFLLTARWIAISKDSKFVPYNYRKCVLYGGTVQYITDTSPASKKLLRCWFYDAIQLNLALGYGVRNYIFSLLHFSLTSNYINLYSPSVFFAGNSISCRLSIVLEEFLESVLRAYMFS